MTTGLVLYFPLSTPKHLRKKKKTSLFNSMSAREEGGIAWEQAV